MRWLLGLALLFAASAAQAQVSPVPPIIGGNLDLGTGVTVQAGAVNLTGPLGLQLSGKPGMQFSPAPNNPAVYAGGAGPNQALTTSDQFLTAFGPGTAGSIVPGTTLELTAFGYGSARYVTGGNGYDAIFQGLGTDTQADHITTIGGFRNTTGDNTTIAIGDNSTRNGTSTLDTVVGPGSSRQGCALCIVFSGNPAPNSTITLTLTTTNASPTRPTTGLPVSVSYTVPSGGASLSTVVSALWNALSPIVSNGTIFYGFTPPFLEAIDSNSPNVLPVDFPGTPTTAGMLNASVSDTASAVTATTAYTNTSQDVFLGVGVASSAALYNLANTSVLIGSFNAANASGFSTGVSVGSLATQKLKSDTSFVAIGYGAGQIMSGTYQNILVGYQAGYQLTSGVFDLLIGGEDNATAEACVTSGQQDIQIGYDVCVPSPTASGQIAIANLIYGTGATGTNYTVSPGSIGIGQPAPGARLDVLGTGTGAELAFRVESSTPSNLFSVADNGTITTGAFSANGTTSVSLSAVAPAGAHATVQEWLTITDNSGNVRYIPAF